MDFEDAKNNLKQRFVDSDFDIIDEGHTEFVISYRRNSRGTRIRVSQEDISAFLDCEQRRSDYKEVPAKTSICSQSDREHLVDYREHDFRRRFSPRPISYVFGDASTHETYVEVGPASTFFVSYFRFEEAYFQMFVLRILRSVGRGRDDFRELHEIDYRPLTIRVRNLQARDIDAAVRHSSPLIDSCLFELSYLTGITLVLNDEWPSRLSRDREFEFGERFSGSQLPLPRVNFNADVVRFYQRGMSTSDPVIQFLSFYQVLEYFFASVSDEQLYDRLSRRINDPKFSTSPVNLDRIIQDTLTHKRETDETEMLKLVLTKYADEAELIEFLKTYEAFLGENLYSRRRTFFGESIEVKLEPGHVIGNVAKRVKVLRNALVHSSDRYDRNQRFVPTASAEKMLKREIPLMSYLAGKVIVASGT